MEWMVSGSFAIERIPSWSKSGNLQEASGKRQVLKKVNELVLVSKVGVEDDRSGDAECGQRACYNPCFEPNDEGKAPSNLQGNHRVVDQVSEGQANACDKPDCAIGGAYFEEAAKDKDGCEQEARDQRNAGLCVDCAVGGSRFKSLCSHEKSPI